MSAPLSPPCRSPTDAKPTTRPRSDACWAVSVAARGLVTPPQDEREQANREAAKQEAGSKGEAHHGQLGLSFAGVPADLCRAGR